MSDYFTATGLSWYTYSLIISVGMICISFSTAIILYIIRRLLERHIEIPGSNALHACACFKDKTWVGRVNAFYWWLLTSLFLFEGVFLLSFSFFLSSFIIFAGVFSQVNVSASIIVTVAVTFLMTTHCFRERNLVNRIHKKEIKHDDQDFEDYEIKNEVEDPTKVEEEINNRKTFPSFETFDITKLDSSAFSSNVSTATLKRRVNKVFFLIPILNNYFDSLRIGLRKKLILYIIINSILCFLAGLFVLLTNRACLCFQPTEASVMISRLALTYSSPSCQHGTICHTYLNLPRDPSTEMIIKLHARDYSYTGAYIGYDIISQSGTIGQYTYLANCTSFDMSYYTYEEDKIVYSCSLSNLQPNTTYFFIAYYDFLQINITTVPSQSYISYIKTSERKFQTLPQTGNINFFIGGDKAAYSQNATLLFKLAASFSPHFLVIGGDLAYANGMSSCYRRWDSFLSDIETNLITPNGTMIPLLTSIGNHEADSGLFQMPRSTAIDFIIYFSHEINSTGITRNLYHYHILSNHSSMIILDSGVVTPHQYQVSFLNTFWSTILANTRKFVTYHAPLYPSARDFNYSMAQIGRTYWEPVFNTYQVKYAFENHDHLCKRTLPIVGGTYPVPGGVVYIGDGALGVAADVLVPETRNYLTTQIISHHIWNVILTNTNSQLTAYDPTGIILDSYNS